MSFFCLTPLLLPLISSAPPVATTSISVGKGRACTAFLFASPDARGLPVFLEMRGTGLYHMGVGPTRDPLAAKLVSSGRLAYLTFNKPGITTDASEKKGFRIDDAIYNKYTPSELTACAAGALNWASSTLHVGKESPIVMHGHSEGAIIAVHTLLRLTQDKAPMAGRVSAVLLSGTPAGAMKDILKAQADKRNKWPEWLAALDKNDDAFFRQVADIGAGTMRAFCALPPLNDTFAALAKTNTQARIAFFHGRNDTNTPIDMVEAIAAENIARSIDGGRLLDISVREYMAGHSLNEGAVHDMALWLADAIRTDGYLASAERPAEPRPTVKLDEATLTAIVGEYKIDDTMSLEISREGNKLFGQATGQKRLPLFAATKDLLFTTVAPLSLKVEREGSTVKALILMQGGEIRCPRVQK